MIISGIADESGADLATQIKAHQELGWQHIELRLIKGRNIAGELSEAEFAVVRDAVEVSDSVLSKHVATLERARLVAVRKGYVGKRPRTWLTLSREGRHALRDHLAALRDIAGA